MGRGSCEEIPTVLATTVLRLQCVEREEKERKDELHAFQSGEERVGGASERLALEQLWFLLQDRIEFVPPESGVEAENENVKTIQEQVKTRTFSAQTTEKIRHPASFNRALVKSGAARRGWPPARIEDAGTRKRVRERRQPLMAGTLPQREQQSRANEVSRASGLDP